MVVYKGKWQFESFGWVGELVMGHRFLQNVGALPACTFQCQLIVWILLKNQSSLMGGILFSIRWGSAMLFCPNATVSHRKELKKAIRQVVVDKRLNVLTKVEGAAGSGTRGNTSKQEESIYMKNQGED
jgi:hypothetical protein